MKCIFLLIGLLAGMASAERIVYSYDDLNRLCIVNYQNQATVQYAYDETHNLESYVVLTDEDYFRAFMLYLTQTGRVLNYLDYLTTGTRFVPMESPSIFNTQKS
jgi:hypothetical protein